MKPLLRFLAFVLLLSAGLGALSLWNPGGGGRARLGLRPSALAGAGYTLAEGPAIDLRTVDALAAQSRARIALAKAVVPSVVAITTTRHLTPQQLSQRSSQQQFFRRFFGFNGGNGNGPGGGGNNNGEEGDNDDNNGGNGGNGGRGGATPDDNDIAARALGSGVIVGREGYILTNNHVIEGMDEFRIELADGRKNLKAKLIGADKPTDLAVLKIEEKDIQALPIGDSDKVEVGQSVLAIGNPFGLEETVTQGIISAKGRQGSENIADLFQTDAAINPGNSGGALINTEGELIGINEAILSRTGGFQGIGFAIPSNVARRVMDGLLKNGRVVRGFLGVTAKELTPKLKEQLGLPNEQGALVGGVEPRSPAGSAGLRAGDFITKFNNRPVKSFQDLRRLVSEVDVGATVPVEVLRGGKTVSVNATLAELPGSLATTNRIPGNRGGGGNNNGGNNGNGNNNAGGNILSGIEVEDLSANLGRQLNVPSDVAGVVVTRVDSGSPAADELQRGDIIEGVNQQPVTNRREYDRLVGAIGADERVALNIIRRGQRSFTIIAP